MLFRMLLTMLGVIGERSNLLVWDDSNTCLTQLGSGISLSLGLCWLLKNANVVSLLKVGSLGTLNPGWHADFANDHLFFQNACSCFQRMIAVSSTS